jgi:hypothetical protein
VGLAKTLQEQGVPVLINDSSWHRLRRPRLSGIPTHFAEILSESSEESLELNEIGYLFAATDNAAYNALVCGQFAGELGRTRVFQLASDNAGEKSSQQIQRGMRGLIAPTAETRYEDLLVNWYQGWTFTSTLLSETYTYEDFTGQMPADSILVALIDHKSKVRFNSPEQPLKPDTGDLLIGYAPPRPKERSKEPATS